MAEVGVIASALQIADIGVRLSLRLYTFGETVASADKSIIAISEHVSLTSTVLKELGQTLDKVQALRICSQNAVQTADSIVKQCQKIFQETDHVLVKKFANTKSVEKDRKIKAAQTLERLKWPFIKGKIDLLMSNLEKEKSTLVLMLNVIALAKQEHERTEPYTIIAEQRSLIEDLAKSNDEYIRKFERLKLSCEEAPIDQDSVPAEWSSSLLTPKTLAAHGIANTVAVEAPSQRQSSADIKGPDRNQYKGSDVSDLSLTDRLDWLLQQYRDLMLTLLSEVSAPRYEIAEDSRSRIKADLVLTQRREMKTLRQVYYPGSWSSANTRKMQTQDPTPAELRADEVSAPVPHVSTQEPNRRWCTSQSEANNQPSAMSIDFIAPSSNRVNKTQPAIQVQPFQATRRTSSTAQPQPATQPQTLQATRRTSSTAQPQPATQPQTPDAQSWTLENNDLRPRSWSRRSKSSPPFPQLEHHSRTVPPAQISSLDSGESTLPNYNRTPESLYELHSTQQESEGDVMLSQQKALSSSEPSSFDLTREATGYKRSLHPEAPSGEPVLQWGSDSLDFSTSKRFRILEVEADAGLATVNKDSSTPQASASEVQSFNNLDSFSRPNLRRKSDRRLSSAIDGGTLHRPESLERMIKDDDSGDWAEHIVDKLLATWTTLPLSASQINFRHGSLAEAAH